MGKGLTKRKAKSVKFEGRPIQEDTWPLNGSTKLGKEVLPERTLPIPEWIMETQDYLMDTCEVVIDNLNPPITIFRVKHRNYGVEFGKYRSLATAVTDMLKEQTELDEATKPRDEDAVN